MKKQDLIELGIAEDVAEKVIIAHGKDIESHKTKVSTLQAENDGLKSQVAEANTAIEGFKALDVDGIKAAADDWKAKYEQSEKDFAAKLVDMDFGKDFDAAIAGAKVKYTNEVKSRLKLDELKDANGKFIAERFNEQIGKIKSESEDLFADAKEPPKIVTGGNNQSVVSDSFDVAMRKGAGLATT
mgnify:CR=1 FL=1